MTSIHTPYSYQYSQPATGSGVASRWTQSVSRIANQWFTLPDRVEKSTSAMAQNAGPFKTRLAKWLGKAGEKVLSFDHFKRLTPLIMSPSDGAFFMIVIPFTVVPRVIQALRRSDNKDDKSELGDILFRDFLTLFFLLYAINPVQNAVTRQLGKYLGLTLTNEGGKGLASEQLDSLYQVKRSSSIADMLKSHDDKSGKLSVDTFKTTLSKNLNRWEQVIEKALQATPETEKQAHQALSQLKKHIADGRQFVNTFNETIVSDSEALKNASAKGYNVFQTLESHVEHAVKPAFEPSNSSLKQAQKILKRAKLLIPSQGVARYAKRTITGISAVSFLVVASLIGVFPPFANNWRNALTFDKQAKRQRERQAAFLLQNLTRQGVNA